jgi:hypothetical protein
VTFKTDSRPYHSGQTGSRKLAYPPTYENRLHTLPAPIDGDFAELFDGSFHILDDFYYVALFSALDPGVFELDSRFPAD